MPRPQIWIGELEQIPEMYSAGVSYGIRNGYNDGPWTELKGIDHITSPAFWRGFYDGSQATRAARKRTKHRRALGRFKDV
jgi:hypothetical protein